MVKLLLTAIIFSAPLGAVAADGQSDGGYVAPELSKRRGNFSTRTI